MQFPTLFPLGNSSPQSKRLSSNRKAGQAGQVVVEYVLLLAVAVGIAFLIRQVLVKGGETPADSGAILQQWDKIEQAIGADDPNHRQ